MESIRLLALSGSLRAASLNLIALKALRLLAPENVDIYIGSIADLPLFDPDLESQCPPSVAELKSSLQHANGLVIASPEYAHGISGPMKNALDWLVSGSEIPDKPVMLINTSPRASIAQAALVEVLSTMSARVVDDATVSIPLLGSAIDSLGIVQHEQMSADLRAGLSALCSDISLRDK